MASEKRNLAAAWPFAPTKVGLNTDTNFLKLVAMLTMFIDHAGKMLFPQYMIMRIIGRLAFPIYAYCIAAGCVYTRDILKYFKRVVLIALISQPFYAVGMGHEARSMYAVSFAEEPVLACINFYVRSWWNPSIMLTLAFGILIIWAIRERQLLLTLALLLFCWIAQNSFDYGFKGIMLIVLFYLVCGTKWWLALPVMSAYMIWWGLQGGGYTLFGVHFGAQMFAVLSLPLICIRMRSGLKINKWVFYFYYPAHIILIMVLDRFVFC